MSPLTVERFWSKVDKSGECWIWIASKRNKGYGAFVWATADGEIVQGRAHRFSWELQNGPIEKGRFILHKCDVPACVNPDHLFVGTNAENIADIDRKGRRVAGGQKSGVDACLYRRGERHHAARLTAAIAENIRTDRVAGMTYGQLAKKFGINPSHACKICKGLLWRQTRKVDEQ